jgi:hypothetical protein
METTRKFLHLDKHSLVQLKIVDMATSFIWIIVLLDRPFEYGDGGNFKLLRWMQNLHHST